MPRHCTICLSGARNAIDRELLAGASFRDIARRYGASPSAVSRHRQAHVERRLAQVRDDAEINDVSTLLADLRSIELETDRLRAMAEGRGDIRTALAAVRELTRITELKARVGERHSRLADQARQVVQAFAMAVRRHVKDSRALLAIRDEMIQYRATGLEPGEALEGGGDSPVAPMTGGRTNVGEKE